MNCYSSGAVRQLLPCTRAQFDVLRTLLAISDQPYDVTAADAEAEDADDDASPHGFELSYIEGDIDDAGVAVAGAFLYNDDQGAFAPYLLPAPFLAQVAEHLRAINCPAWRVGVAHWSDKTRRGSFGGYWFELTADARVRPDPEMQVDWIAQTDSWKTATQILHGITFDLWAVAVVRGADGGPDYWKAEDPSNQNIVDAVLGMTGELCSGSTCDGLLEMDGKRWCVALFPADPAKQSLSL